MKPKRNVDLDIEIRGLFPDREMRITKLSVDHHSVALHYRISPALPDRDPGDGSPWLTWDWSGVDDLGNEYASWGGAYGTSDDGRSTDGDLTLSPAPADGARLLRVHLAPFRHNEGDLGTAMAEIPVSLDSPEAD
jgi:hypothetical protein